MMRGFLAASSSAGSKAWSASRRSSSSTSAVFSMIAKLGFMGTAWMSSTPVAMLLTSRRSPPMCRAMSARSGIVAITLILSAVRPGPGSTASAAINTAESSLFIMRSSSVLEAVDVAPEDDRPLQEELVVVVPGRLEPRVLEPQPLELRRPHRQVRRVRQGGTHARVDVLRVLEEETGIVAPGETRLDVGVEPNGVLVLEDERRSGARVGWESTDGTVLVVEERLGAPHEPAVPRLAERRVAVGELEAGERPLGTVVLLHLRRE